KLIQFILVLFDAKRWIIEAGQNKDGLFQLLQGRESAGQGLRKILFNAAVCYPANDLIDQILILRVGYLAFMLIQQWNCLLSQFKQPVPYLRLHKGIGIIQQKYKRLYFRFTNHNVATNKTFSKVITIII